MLTETLLDAFFSFVDGLLSHLPAINITVPANVITSAAQFFRVAAYIIPFSTVAQILGLIIALQVFRIAVSLIKTIWALLPIV